MMDRRHHGTNHCADCLKNTTYMSPSRRYSRRCKVTFKTDGQVRKVYEYLGAVRNTCEKTLLRRSGTTSIQYGDPHGNRVIAVAKHALSIDGDLKKE